MWQGKVTEQVCQIIVDTGASTTSVQRILLFAWKLSERSENYVIYTASEDPLVLKCVDIKIGNKKIRRLVVFVANTQNYPVVLNAGRKSMNIGNEVLSLKANSKGVGSIQDVLAYDNSLTGLGRDGWDAGTCIYNHKQPPSIR